MSQTTKHRNQPQFGDHAASYIASTVHSSGESLSRLRELTDPQADWRILDVATGSGHNALSFAPSVREVVAADLTHKMLLVARDFAAARDSRNMVYCQHDAEAIPFASGTFDCVTCRIAPHHFSNLTSFVSESARVLKPGGLLAVADNIVSGEPRSARLTNRIEAFRDPSHHWAYSSDDWRAFIIGTGLNVTSNEELTKDMDFDEWAARSGVSESDRIRLLTLILNGPEDVQTWFSPRKVGYRLVFTLHEGIIIGQKPYP